MEPDKFFHVHPLTPDTISARFDEFVVELDVVEVVEELIVEDDVKEETNLEVVEENELVFTEVDERVDSSVMEELVFEEMLLEELVLTRG
jgi:hypothetical protein